jgi:hypothetical protein
MRHKRVGRKVCFASLIIGVTLASSLIATPSAVAQESYPDISSFKPVRTSDIQMYTQLNEYGMWFATPNGLNCAIGEDGSFGCSGVLPGAQHGENEIGWFPGDSSPRLYHTDEPKFIAGRPQQILPGQRFLTYRGVTCAVTRANRVYCFRADDLNTQFMVGNYMSWRGSQAQPIG